MSYWYLASPYSKYPGGINLAFEEACRQTALLIRAGVRVHSPIANTHPVAIYGDIDPLDHKIWLPADEPFMRAAKGLIVCQMDGWEASYGIGEEIKAFRAARKQIVYMTPGQVPMEVLPRRQRILGLCGYARSGKDTAAAALVDAGWTRVAFADAVREALLALNPEIKLASLGSYLKCWGDWEEVKRWPEVRELLQRMGTEVGRNFFGENCWVDIAKRKIDAVFPGDVVITDVRFPNEAQAIRDWGGTIVRIERPGVGPVNGHASEQLAFDPDEIIENVRTIEDLHAHILLLADICRDGHGQDIAEELDPPPHREVSHAH